MSSVRPSSQSGRSVAYERRTPRLAVGLETEQHARAGARAFPRPTLVGATPSGRQRERRVRRRAKPREDLGQAMVEERGGLDHAAQDPLRPRARGRCERDPTRSRSCRAARRFRCGTRAGCRRSRPQPSCGRPSRTRGARPSTCRRRRRRAPAGRSRSTAGDPCSSRVRRSAACHGRARARKSRPAQNAWLNRCRSAAASCSRRSAVVASRHTRRASSAMRSLAS